MNGWAGADLYANLFIFLLLICVVLLMAAPGDPNNREHQLPEIELPEGKGVPAARETAMTVTFTGKGYYLEDELYVDIRDLEEALKAFKTGKEAAVPTTVTIRLSSDYQGFTDLIELLQQYGMDNFQLSVRSQT